MSPPPPRPAGPPEGAPGPHQTRRLSGRWVVFIFLLLAGAIGGGIRYMLATMPAGSGP